MEGRKEGPKDGMPNTLSLRFPSKRQGTIKGEHSEYWLIRYEIFKNWL